MCQVLGVSTRDHAHGDDEDGGGERDLASKILTKIAGGPCAAESDARRRPAQTWDVDVKRSR